MTSWLVVAPEESSSFYLSQLLARGYLISDPAYGVVSQSLEKRWDSFRSLAPAREIAIMGFFEAIRKMPTFFRLKAHIESLIRQGKINAALLMDFGGFNLRLLPLLNRYKIPTIYWVLPQIWIWRRKRIEWFQKYPATLVAQFRPEWNFFQSAGLNVHFLGHCLPFSMPPFLWDQSWRGQRRARLGFRSDQKIVGWLLGSRLEEIRSLLPIFVRAGSELYRQDRRVLFVWVLPPGLDRSEVLKNLPFQGKWDFPWVIHQPENSAESLAIMDIAWAKSGTVSLQLALLGIPHVSVYRVNPITGWWVRRQYELPTFNLVNLLLQESVVPELLQDQLHPKALVEFAQKNLSQLGDFLGPYWGKLVGELLPHPGQKGFVPEVWDHLCSLKGQKTTINQAYEFWRLLWDKYPFWDQLGKLFVE